MSNYESLPFRQFTAKSEADKAINSLKGILLGINLDHEVNDLELKELDNWCKAHAVIIRKNPFKEFMMVIQEAIAEPDNRVDLIQDLYWLSQKYENDNVYYNAATADLQTLQGICHGILADGIIKDEEVKMLDSWLEENEYLSTYYPYDEIRSLIISVLSDGKIDDEERERLKAFFKDFVKLSDTQLQQQIDDETAHIKIGGICTMYPDVSFDGTRFCFTGVLARAKRTELKKLITDMGGVFEDRVTHQTDYLIVGDGGNPCWAFACYGRKVEKAIGLRKEGYTLSVVHEFDFWDSVEDLR